MPWNRRCPALRLEGPRVTSPNVIPLLRACMTIALATLVVAVCLPLAFYALAVIGSRSSVRYYYGA